MSASNLTRPRIALLCATRRGVRFLERLVRVAPHADLLVMSFPEEPGEPAFLEEIRTLAETSGATFVQARQVAHEKHKAVWNVPLDLLFAVSWRYMVPPRIYGKARRGAFVFHDSLLPAYRGFAPTVWAMVNGEHSTGVTLFEMAESVDSGAIVDQREVPIGIDDDIAAVLERVTDAYLELLEANLAALLDGSAPRRQQDETRATYTCRRLAADGRIDWAQPTRRIYDLIRAVTTPYWGAFTSLDGREVRILASQLLPDLPLYIARIPGRIVEVRPGVGTVVLTGDGALLVTQVKVEGEVVCASTVLNSLSQTLGR